MIDRMILHSVLIWATYGLTVQPLLAQSTSVPISAVHTRDLPRGTMVKDAGPRTYRFTVDYDTANRTGDGVHRQLVTGDYTRGLANGEVEGTDVGIAEVDGVTAPVPVPQKRDFMAGFHYPVGSPDTLKPDFFKSFPPK